MITPAIFCKNEEYWMHYVLRDLIKCFDNIVVLDTGSTDSTLDILRNTDRITLIEEHYGDNPKLIGNSPNVLRGLVDTDWMLLVAGDEIWLEPQLLDLIELVAKIPSNKTVGMATGRNIGFRDGKFFEFAGMSADRLFRKSVIWDKVDYPDESHGLHSRLDRGEVEYLPVNYWHVRDLQRSSQDESTYYRSKKIDYYQRVQHKELPVDWLGEVNKNLILPDEYFNDLK